MDSDLSRKPSDCRRPDLSGRIVRFDELRPADRDELARHASACPVCGPRLAIVERTHGWLVAQSGALEACPNADELFDFGQGPGADTLAPERRMAIDEHVDRCPECKGFVATLARKPPVPLDLGEPLPAEQNGTASAPAAEMLALRPSALEGSGVHSPRSRPKQALWAAAAAAVIGLGLWAGLAPEGAWAGEALGYPALEPFRSATASQLVFPRGRVAFDARTAAPHFELTFELMPHAEADSYYIELHRHSGGAFDPGERIGGLESDEPLTSAAALGALAPGHYTWSAWARVGELELPMGERDFELRADAQLDAHWSETAEVDEPQRSFQRLHWLVDQGFATDARQLARSLPASRERDEFLARQAER